MVSIDEYISPMDPMGPMETFPYCGTQDCRETRFRYASGIKSRLRTDTQKNGTSLLFLKDTWWFLMGDVHHQE